jgi:hypothetical protein
MLPSRGNASPFCGRAIIFEILSPPTEMKRTAAAAFSSGPPLGCPMPARVNQRLQNHEAQRLQRVTHRQCGKPHAQADEEAVRRPTQPYANDPLRPRDPSLDEGVLLPLRARAGSRSRSRLELSCAGRSRLDQREGRAHAPSPIPRRTWFRSASRGDSGGRNS